MDTRIRALREDRDLTQKDIAAALHIPTNTYRNYELGTRTMPLEILVEIAKYYQTSTDYLLGLTDCKDAYPRTSF